MHDVTAPPDLTRLPITKCWPLDAGRFITFGMVETADPETGVRNLGIYRLQRLGADRTRNALADPEGGRLPLSQGGVARRGAAGGGDVGADPAILLASVAPLPEAIDELAFAGFLRGAPTELASARTIPLDVPARAEFILEGEVRARRARARGPVRRSLRSLLAPAPYPVFRLRTITHRAQRDLRRVDGRQAAAGGQGDGRGGRHDVLAGVRLIHPEVHDLWAYFEAGFHNLLVVSVGERYAKEGMKAALGLLGQGQLSLTKCLVLVDEDRAGARFQRRAARDPQQLRFRGGFPALARRPARHARLHFVTR